MKTLLIIFFLMFSKLAFAEWVLVANTGSGDSWYIDPSTIKTVNGYKEFWVLSDLKSPLKKMPGRSKETYSYKERLRVSCSEEKFMSLSAVEYSGGMGNGEVVLNDGDPSKWKYSPPDSAIYLIIKRGCK